MAPLMTTGRLSVSHYICLILFLSTAAMFVYYSTTCTNMSAIQSQIRYESNESRIPSPSISAVMNESVTNENITEFLVHYVRFYKSTPSPICYSECISVLSVIKNLKPDRIYVHTDHPDFWPFDSCNNVIKTWVPVHIVYRQRTFLTAGKRVDIIEHQADIAKLQALKEYGGAALDLDVFMIQGFRVRETLRNFECMIGQEGPKMMNAGFAACRKGAEWPILLLKHYEKDYQTGWWYNSAQLPFRLYRESKSLQKSVFVDATISDNPPGWEKGKMLDKSGIVDWKSKVGYQSFFHDCKFNATNVNASTSSFGELLRWVLETK